MKASVKWLKEWVNFPCSYEELGKVFTHLGIEVVSYEKCGEDNYYNLDIRPNRPDLLSITGLAREISAYFSIPLVEGRSDITPIKPLSMDVVVEEKEDCPRYTIRCIEGIKVETSPDHLSKRLECSGINSINQIVDISNWVMLEIGQPLHIFDRDKIKGKIFVRRAKKNEKIITLDGQERKLTPEILVIADEEKVLAIAGIIGGLYSSVIASTKNIAIESAYFDPVRITKGSRALALKTESSIRFERGGDIDILPYSQELAADLIQRANHIKVEEKIFDSNPDVKTKKVIEINKEKGEKLLGISLNMDDVVEKVERFGIKNVGNNPVKFHVPSFRRDIKGESDIWEEYARLLGYDNIPHRFRIKSNEIPYDPRFEFRRLRKICAFSGFYEVCNMSFMESSVIELLGGDINNAVFLENPMWIEKDIMRTTLILGLLESAKRNANKGITDIRLFEMGNVFFSPNTEKTFLSGIIMGNFPREWHSPERKYDFYDIKGGIETFLSHYGVDFTFLFQNYLFFEDNISLGIRVNNRVVGFIGKIKSIILDKYDISEAYGFEIDAELLVDARNTGIHINLPPKYPSIRRDISLILSQDIGSDFVLTLIKDINIPVMEDVRLIDVYTGKNVPQGKKGFTYSIIFRVKDRTLRDTEVDEIMEEILALLEKNNIEIRRQ